MALNYAYMLIGVGNDADNGGICGDEPRQQADTLGFSQFAPVNSGLVFFCLFCVNKNAEFAPFFVSFESDMEGKLAARFIPAQSVTKVLLSIRIYGEDCR